MAELVNKKSITVLAFLIKQYPQTKIEAPNVNLRAAVPNINEKGRIDYEMVRQSKVEFRKKKSADYAP